jgi:hypothetical protein
MLQGSLQDSKHSVHHARRALSQAGVRQINIKLAAALAGLHLSERDYLAPQRTTSQKHLVPRISHALGTTLTCLVDRDRGLW